MLEGKVTVCETEIDVTETVEPPNAEEILVTAEKLLRQLTDDER